MNQDGIFFKAVLGLKRNLIERALRRCNGNVVKAAKYLGITRPTLYDQARRAGLNPKNFRRKK